MRDIPATLLRDRRYQAGEGTCWKIASAFVRQEMNYSIKALVFSPMLMDCRWLAETGVGYRTWTLRQLTKKCTIFLEYELSET